MAVARSTSLSGSRSSTPRPVSRPRSLPAATSSASTRPSRGPSPTRRATKPTSRPSRAATDRPTETGGLPMPHVEQLIAGERTARVHLRIPDSATSGVVVLHAWWGLNDDVIAYADRLADAGYAVAAPDMFGGQVATTREDADRLSQEQESAGVDAIVRA